MFLLRKASLERAAKLARADPKEIKDFRRALGASELPNTLIQRGAGLPFTLEFPQGALLYILVRALHPAHVVETGVRPGYTTSWILAALNDNASGTLASLGPGPTAHRSQSVRDVAVGQFVPPALRARWTLVLGNTVDNLRKLLEEQRPIDLFFYDNGPDSVRAGLELHAAWSSLSAGGVLLAHHVDANPAWAEFCRAQGLPAQILDPGPPRLGAVGMRTDRTA